MSQSLCIDTEDWLGAGCVSIGDTGGGVLGSSIPATGDDGPGYAYPMLVLPADADKEVCGRIVSVPVGLTLFAHEDTSSIASANDGTYTMYYQPYLDYVPYGSPLAVVYQFGATNATASGATLTATSSLSAGAATGAGDAEVAGAAMTSGATLIGGAATGEGNSTAAGANLTAASSLVPGAASGTMSSAASGAELTAVSALVAGAASGTASATAMGATLTAMATLAGGAAADAGGYIAADFVYTIAAEDRRYTVPSEDRRYTIT